MKKSFFVYGCIILLSALAFFIGDLVLVGKIRRIDLLMKNSRQVGAEVIDKRVRGGKGDDDHLIIYETTTPDGPVSGEFKTTPEDWDQIEMGSNIPVWYVPGNTQISQGSAPTQEQQFGAKNNYYLFLAVWGCLTATFLWGFYVMTRYERRLAIDGIARLALFTVQSMVDGSYTAYYAAWSVPDNEGKIVEVIVPITSSNPKYPVGGSGQGVLLVAPENVKECKPWQDFKWIQIEAEQ